LLVVEVALALDEALVLGAGAALVAPLLGAVVLVFGAL
jgi:hypothetical protein